ncbi:hypothetical protein JCGZ_05063 [Jatropha curcas]|uniref:Uncharacterized protein n=1 Tax=Jatropha curcas TaxID=180498 RepID=A0A067J9V9_JATCU|nr:hypothetical protein JCGZ_05063 [Jatropha curcas]
MASSPVGLLAVRENWLFEPQNLGIHTSRFGTIPTRCAVSNLRRELRDAAVLASSCVMQLFLCEQLHDAAVDLGKARAGGSSTDASAFWDLLDPSMRSRVVAAGFGDYAAGLR